MKSFAKLFLIPSLALSLAACQDASTLNDEPMSEDGSTTNPVTFNIDIPQELRTRADSDVFAFGDGAQIQNLRYALYLYPSTVPDDQLKNPANPKWQQVITSSDAGAKQATKSGNKFSLTIDLPLNYKVVGFFWADHSGLNDIYSLDFNNCTITVDYKKQFENMFNDYGDAFMAVWDSKSSTDNSWNLKQSYSITLKRPFVQVNCLTDEDMNNYYKVFDQHPMCLFGGANISEGTIALDNVYNYFTGKYTNKTYDIEEFNLPDIGNKTATFKNRTMRYLGVSYVFPSMAYDDYTTFLRANTTPKKTITTKSIDWHIDKGNVRVVLYNKEGTSWVQTGVNFNILIDTTYETTTSEEV